MKIFIFKQNKKNLSKLDSYKLTLKFTCQFDKKFEFEVIYYKGNCKDMKYNFVLILQIRI